MTARKTKASPIDLPVWRTPSVLVTETVRPLTPNVNSSRTRSGIMAEMGSKFAVSTTAITNITRETTAIPVRSTVLLKLVFAMQTCVPYQIELVSEPGEVSDDLLPGEL